MHAAAAAFRGTTPSMATTDGPHHAAPSDA